MLSSVLFICLNIIVIGLLIRQMCVERETNLLKHNYDKYMKNNENAQIYMQALFARPSWKEELVAAYLIAVFVTFNIYFISTLMSSVMAPEYYFVIYFMTLIVSYLIVSKYTNFIRWHIDSPYPHSLEKLK
jgi:hypothetical protein